MKTEYGRISVCLGMLLVFASGTNAQTQKPVPNDATIKLPEDIEEILKIEDGPILVQSTPQNATSDTFDYEPIENLVSIEAQMILLAQTKTQTKVFVPQHVSPNFFARLFGGTIIPTREMVAPSNE